MAFGYIPRVAQARKEKVNEVRMEQQSTIIRITHYQNRNWQRKSEDDGIKIFKLTTSKFNQTRDHAKNAAQSRRFSYEE
jgi:hypothetical protein